MKKPRILWKRDLTNTSAFLQKNLKRRLFVYGITLGRYGFVVIRMTDPKE